MSWLESNPISGSIIGSGISAASSLGVGLLNYFSQRETNDLNRELADLSYQRNVEQWNRENAYNHPSAQMARLQEAGLNPNLVYGNGSAVQTSARSPQMEYPEMKAPNLQATLPNFFSDMLNMKLKVAEIQNVESITDKNKAEKDLAVANSIIAGHVGKMREFESQKQQELYDETIKELRGRIELQGYQKEEYESRKAQRAEEVEREKRMNEFWDAHPELFWLRELLDSLKPVIPGIMGIGEAIIKSRFGGNKRKGRAQYDSEGNIKGWTFDIEE